MATTISTQDLENVKEDIEDIGEAVNEKVIVYPRYGEPFKSLPMIAGEFQISSDAAESAAVSAAESANIAEAAATAATIGAGVFETPESGVDPVTGVPDGAYFNVRSSSDESYVDEYQNVGGVPTPTGKTYPSGASLLQVKQLVDGVIDPISGKIDANNVFDGSDSLKTLNNKFKNRIVYFEDHVSDVTGTADVTAEMQSLLDSHGGDIYAKSTSIFKTSNTLFNRKHNRTIDFHNAKIVNKANSMYAIVTISPSFTGSTDAELVAFTNQRHYGEEVNSSHIKDIRYEMSANSGGGNNLGVGIIYGYRCKASKLYPKMTNGNGFEIRNSLRCCLYNSEIEGHRNYTCFVFMSQRCEIIGNKFKGGTRGVCTKMNRDGDRYCGHIIAHNTFEDATNNGRAIIGGEWRETTLTHEIYVPGHEWVDGNEVYGNTFININQQQTISAACFSRGWKIYDNVFKWNNLSGTIFNAGGEGNTVAGELLLGGHKFYENEIYDYLGEASAMITARLPTKVFKNKYFNCRAKYWLLSQIDVAGNKLEYAEYTNNELIGDQNAVYCHNAGEHGFVATADVKNFVFKGNKGLLRCLQNSTYVYATIVASSADTIDLSGGDFQVSANAGVTGITAAIIYRGAIRNLTGRKISVSAPTTAIGLQLQSGVDVQSKHENNTYVLTGAATTARAVVNNTDFVDGINTYTGAWQSKVFNNFEQPVALLNIDRQSLTIPTTGSYKKGDFVRNTNPLIVSNSVVFGWLRITTGSAHVLNTDWVEIKQSIT